MMKLNQITGSVDVEARKIAVLGCFDSKANLVMEAKKICTVVCKLLLT